MVTLLPPPARRARLLRLLVVFVLCYGVTATGFVLYFGDWAFSLWDLLGGWVLVAVLPVVGGLGLLWAIPARPSDSTAS
jgi:hypothetical protein